MTASSSDLRAYEREIQLQIARTRQSMGHKEFEQALDRFVDTVAFLGWVDDCISVAGGFVPDDVMDAIGARYLHFPETYEEGEPGGEACFLLAALSAWAISALQVTYDEQYWAGILAGANRDPRLFKIQEYRARDADTAEKPGRQLLPFETWKRTAFITPV